MRSRSQITLLFTASCLNNLQCRFLPYCLVCNANVCNTCTGIKTSYIWEPRCLWTSLSNIATKDLLTHCTMQGFPNILASIAYHQFFLFSYDRADIMSLLLLELLSCLSSVANIIGDAHMCGYIHLNHLYSLARLSICEITGFIIWCKGHEKNLP